VAAAGAVAVALDTHLLQELPNRPGRSASQGAVAVPLVVAVESKLVAAAALPLDRNCRSGSRAGYATGTLREDRHPSSDLH
jgi:hypothetical protein